MRTSEYISWVPHPLPFYQHISSRPALSIVRILGFHRFCPRSSPNRDIGAEILAGIEEIQSFKKGQKKLRTKALSEPSAPNIIRAKLKMSQAAFAAMLGVSRRNLQDWEQGRREPNGPAVALLRIAEQHPEVFSDLH
ncbi:helix-turn-helix domain-containing protein [Aliiglaciecola litoralis]|uniref:helix-turn-helix domain-containing protein n=1 Tax=Aliiglaciecola litoralis TaxID=582857 RepID=UPI0031DDD49A